MDLFGLLGWVSDSIGGQISAVVGWATAGFGTLFGNIAGVWSILQDLIKWATGAVGAIVSFLQALWDWLRNGPLSGLIDKLIEIWDKLKKWLKEAKKIIQQMKDNMQQMWDQ